MYCEECNCKKCIKRKEQVRERLVKMMEMHYKKTGEIFTKEIRDALNTNVGDTKKEDYWHEELEELVNDYRNNPLRDSVKMHEFVRKVIKNEKKG